jgi:hypothetical protein
MLLDTARRREGHGGRGVYGDGAMAASGEEGEGERRGGVALGLVPGAEGEFLSPPDAPWVAAVDRRGGGPVCGRGRGRQRAGRSSRLGETPGWVGPGTVALGPVAVGFFFFFFFIFFFCFLSISNNFCKI